MKTKPDPNFLLDEHSILRKAVKLKYTIEPTIVAPRNIICQLCYGLHWTITNVITRIQARTNTYLSINIIFNNSVPEEKMPDEVSMAYIKEILQKTSCPKFILQDNGTEFKNEQLMSVFNSLHINHIYSNP